MNIKVSIIVPIYNMEQYLNRCIESLLSQTLNEIEIIAVNDGSIDRSLEIIESYRRADSRVKVISQENAGVSAARNAGIPYASGEYIGFVDPDDWVEKTMYSELFNIASTRNAEISMCGYLREFNTHTKEKIYKLPNIMEYSNEDLNLNILRKLFGPLKDELGNPEMLDAWGTVWSKIYRSDLIKNNNIQFTDLKKIGTNEDTLFNIQAFYCANKFIFINKPFYHYWKSNTSSITSYYKPDLLKKWVCLFQVLKEFIECNNLSIEFSQALNNRICVNTLGLSLNILYARKTNKHKHLDNVRKIKEILNSELIKQSFKNIQLREFPLIWRFFYFSAKQRWSLSLYLLITIIDFLRRKLK